MNHFQQAYNLALLSEKYPRVGCVIVRKKKTLSFSHNINKSHPLQKELNYLRFNDKYFDTCSHSQHAEFVAIQSVKNKSLLEGSKIFIVRLDSKGKIMPSNPCKACQNLIDKYGIEVQTIY